MLAPDQFAQTNSEVGSYIVRRIETVLGTATALLLVELMVGYPSMAGHVSQTNTEASLGVVFADNTTLSLGEGGRLVV